MARSLICGALLNAAVSGSRQGETVVSKLVSNALASHAQRDFMRAFILRRLIMINRSQGNIILIGSRYRNRFEERQA
jgi:hypothetical protein